MTGGRSAVIAEPAYAKLNLVLQVGAPRPDGMHPLCSIFASIDLADEVEVAPAAEDAVDCPGVDGPNLAARAVEVLRRRVPTLPPLAVRIEKRIPVAAGLGGGSADAAAVLRAANRVAAEPLAAAELRELATELGSDVPSQVEPGHAIVQGAGEVVEPLELSRLGAVLVPQAEGLSTAEVYAQLDRMRAWREALDPDRLREIAARGDLPTRLESDLEPAALALRPELADVLETLRAAGAPRALVSGSGPTCFGLFEDRAAAEAAAARLPGAIAAELRAGLP
jgi:4-diphosphocytidyl-2-C-methyl-D-erythritol kinase